MVDWVGIKTEYITTATSYRKLADKHGVPFRTLADRARAEGWSAARKKHCNDVVTKALRKSANQQADKMARFTTVSDKLLNWIGRSRRLVLPICGGRLSLRIRQRVLSWRSWDCRRSLRYEYDRP